MKILLTNDDGCASPLLQGLERKLRADAETCVCAPMTNQSGVSSSLSIGAPTVVKTADDGNRIVSGTPVDCVHLGLTVPGLLPWPRPDLTVSGINFGRNLGNDALYSGTIAAAAESVAFGIPAVALSLHFPGGSKFADADADYDGVIGLARDLVMGLKDRLLANPATLLNVNIPFLPVDRIKPAAACRLGQDHPPRRIEADPAAAPSAAHECYRIGELMLAGGHPPASDYALLEQGHVTVTPLRFDLTDDSKMQAVAAWTK
ncbi:MAG: 5'/3'-nucleotidase SurE [Betaproteobacteria bacterium AqS2]|uniref:5'-nucleotidase SurE n=1 Tax=Candidatus Amphirhobacter heronislandensis TaxID=1732024 RepID=A0A930UD49_9GAMM|nr:5'/3'-nucleotidase SurE [Betaproteobacteria bacterium AqS2]